MQINLENVEMLDIFDTSSSSSSSESSDEEFEQRYKEVLNLPTSPRHRRNIHRTKCFDAYNEDEFERRFRIPKFIVLELATRLERQLGYRNRRNNPVPVVDQILITLRYYATSSFQIVTGDLFGVSQSTVSRVVYRVSKLLAQVAKTEINMPSTHSQLRETKQGFYNMQGIPHIIGAIDGTHIAIQSVGGEYAEDFRNRKGIFSINCQIVADANMRILNLDARWPGSCHDQTMFNFSKLRARLEAGEFGDGYLIGDAGYACKKYLLTPLGSPSTPAEISFNNAFVRTRRIIEQTIGVWKRRFPVIGTKMRLNVERTVVVIVATAYLHNLLKERDVPPVEIEMEDTDNENPIPLNNEHNDFCRREYIINNFF